MRCDPDCGGPGPSSSRSDRRRAWRAGDHRRAVRGRGEHRRVQAASRLLRVDIGAVRDEQRSRRRRSPDAAANISDDVPFDVRAFTSAPALSSGSMTAALPFLAASSSGVYAPILVVASGWRRRTAASARASASFLIAAQCSAVMPSPCAALTSAACFRSFTAPSSSPCWPRRPAPCSTTAPTAGRRGTVRRRR